MGTGSKWFHLVLISVMNGAGADELLIAASTSQNNTLVVTQGTNVSITCYTRENSSLTKVDWSRGAKIGTTRFDESTQNCTVEPGQFDDLGGQTQLSCNRTSSTIVIQGVHQADSKEWTCLATSFRHRSITLKVESVSSSVSISTTTTTTTTTTTITGPPSTPEPTIQPPASTSTSAIDITNGLPTATPGQASIPSREQTTLEHHPDTRGEETNRGTQLYIILPSTLGGAATLVLCVFMAWKTRTSRKRNLTNGPLQTKGSDSQDEILEMQENPAYWASMEAATSSSSPFVKADMQDNPVYWTSNNATVDSVPQLKDKHGKEKPFYWTIESISTDHPNHSKTEDEQANHIYSTIEADSQGPSDSSKG